MLHHIKRFSLIIVVLLPLYGLAVVLPTPGFRGYPTTPFLFLYLALVFLIDSRFAERKAKVPAKLLRAAVYGFIASVLSYQTAVAWVRGGDFLQTVVNSLSLGHSSIDHVFAFAWMFLGIPFILLGWLYGLVVGAVLLYAKRYRSRARSAAVGS